MHNVSKSHHQSRTTLKAHLIILMHLVKARKKFNWQCYTVQTDGPHTETAPSSLQI